MSATSGHEDPVACSAPSRPGSSRLRRLPWDTLEGKPCLLSTSGGETTLSRIADEVEAAQLDVAHRVLDSVDDVLAIQPSKLSVSQTRYMLARAQEVLSDVLRVAESRGERLDASKWDDPQGGTRTPAPVPEARADPCP